MTHPSILGIDPTAGGFEAPTGESDELRLCWPDEVACQATAATLAACPALAEALITLEGDLGAGKTTFTRYLLRALGVRGRVRSPTYAIVEPHEAVQADGRALTVHHFDFYRMADPREALDAGLRDVLTGPGLKVCEWPQRAGPLLGTPDLRVHIDITDDEQRRVSLAAGTEAGRQLLQALRGAPPA